MLAELKLEQELHVRRATSSDHYWLTRATKTQDEQDSVNPLKSFPDREYFRYILDVFESEQVVFVEKSRTMMLTWLACGWASHKMNVRPYTGVLFQSKDEDRAVHCVDCSKVLWRESEEQLKSRWPLKKPYDKQAYNTFELANGSWAIGIPGDPNKIRSFHPTIIVFDEAAFMPNFDACYSSAVATKALKIIAITSAEVGSFRDLTKDARPCKWPGTDSFEPMPGLTMRRTEAGIPVIRLHVSADPAYRSIEAMAGLRRLYLSEARYRQEIEIDYEALSGALVFPEFNEKVHVIKHEDIPRRGCLYMAIDPHPRTPHAFLWVLIDRWSDWYIYREVWPSISYGSWRRISDDESDNSYTIREYGEAIAACEGNAIEYYNPETEREYGLYSNRPDGERILRRYMDQAGKGFKASDEAALLETYAKRYQRYGINCQDPKKSHESGEDAIRQLLYSRKHDVFGSWPRLHISDRCPELILELKNYRFEITKTIGLDKDLKQTPTKFRTHGVDLLRYLATAPIDYSESRACRRVS